MKKKRNNLIFRSYPSTTLRTNGEKNQENKDNSMNKNILMFCSLLTFASHIVIHSMNDNTRVLPNTVVQKRINCMKEQYTKNNFEAGVKQGNIADLRGAYIHYLKQYSTSNNVKHFYKAVEHLHTANIRLAQDSQCLRKNIRDVQVKTSEGNEFFENNIHTAALEYHPEIEFKEPALCENKRTELITTALTKMQKLTEEGKLPPPNEALNYLIYKPNEIANNLLISQEQWQEKRKKVINEYFQALSNTHG